MLTLLHVEQRCNWLLVIPKLLFLYFYWAAIDGLMSLIKLCALVSQVVRVTHLS